MSHTLHRTDGWYIYTNKSTMTDKTCSQDEPSWKYAYVLEETNGNGTTNPDIEIARMVRPGQQITMILGKKTLWDHNRLEEDSVKSECNVEGEDIAEIFTLYLEISDFKAKKIFRVPVYEIRLDQEELNEWFKDRKVWKTSNVYHMQESEVEQHNDDVMDLFDIQPEDEDQLVSMDITDEDLEALKSDAMFHGTIRALEDLKTLEASKQNKIVHKV